MKRLLGHIFNAIAYVFCLIAMLMIAIVVWPIVFISECMEEVQTKEARE